MTMEAELIDIKLPTIKAKYKSDEAFPKFQEATNTLTIEGVIDDLWMTPEEFNLVFLMPLDRIKELYEAPEKATFAERFYLLQIKSNAYDVTVELGTRWMFKAIGAARWKLRRKMQEKSGLERRLEEEDA